MLSLSAMVPRDTKPGVAALQDEIHRGFSPADRLRMTIEMSEFARSLSRAGLRSRRPELTESELDDEMLHQLYGFRPARK
jgi:Rv0078B-related antitoxin